MSEPVVVLRFVGRERRVEYATFVGPFEYVEWKPVMNEATPMGLGKATQWTLALGAEAWPASRAARATEIDAKTKKDSDEYGYPMHVSYGSY